MCKLIQYTEGTLAYIPRTSALCPDIVALVEAETGDDKLYLINNKHNTK